MPVSPGAHDSAGGGRVAAVDGVRAVGFLLVFGYHTWVYGGHPDLGPLSTLVAQNTRPDLFVVLTGFLLFLPLARRSGQRATLDTRRYLRRRMRRIVLPYWVAVGFAVLLPHALVLATRAVGMESAARSWPTWPDLISHLSFTHLFFGDYWASINGSLWTMSLEMQLYLAFPLLVLAWDRWGWRAWAGALGVWLAYRIAVLVWVPDRGFPSRFLWEAQAPGRLVELVAGMVAAILLARHLERPDARRATAYLLIAAIGYAAAVAPLSDGTPVREAGLGVAFGALILAVLASRRVSAACASRVMVRLGIMSYSLFLIHEPIAWYLSELLRRGAGVPDGIARVLLLWTLGLAVTVAVGWLFYRWVEVPCLTWARAVPSPTQAPVGAPPPGREPQRPRH